MKKQIILISLVLIISLNCVHAAITDNLISYWSFDEPSGNAINSVKTGLDGTNNGATVVAGKINNARSFTGGQYIEVPDNNIYDLTTAFTLSAWVNVRNTFVTSDNLAIISKQYNTGSNYPAYVMYMNEQTASMNRSGLITSSDGTTHTSDHIPTNNNALKGQWNLITTSYNNGEIKYYVNGINVYNYTSAVTPGNSADSLIIGRWRIGTSSSSMEGMIDEVGMWNRVLTDTEVLQLYNNGIGFDPFNVSIININCTTTGSSGDTTPPYSTNTTTPTFSFNTIYNASCRISDKNINYSSMNSSRNCSTGQGTASHVCTLTAQDALITITDWVYITCQNTTGGSEFSAPLLMDVLPLPNNITNVNCTTVEPNGDTTSPYSTNTTTPTFSFVTSGDSNCRISHTNTSYNSLDSSRDCSTGQNTISHVCTLIAQDALVNTTDYVYINCLYAYNSNETNISLLMDVLPLANNITNVNCTGAGPSGDITPPYSTNDTTPTFSFNTTSNSSCRMSDRYLAYDLLNSSRDCLSGQNTTGHICTLTVQDELVNASDYAYIVCQKYGNETAISLLMDIQYLDANDSRAIEYGIMASTIWPGATIYSNQKVYLRALNGSTKTATVDKVAVYGNQRWILHYENESEPAMNLFNLTPVVYVLEMKNISLTQIRATVTAFINSTKI